jgi:hypothetical protein
MKRILLATLITAVCFFLTIPSSAHRGEGNQRASKVTQSSESWKSDPYSLFANPFFADPQATPPPRVQSATAPDSDKGRLNTVQTVLLPSSRFNLTMDLSQTVHQLARIDPGSYRTKPNQIAISRITDLSMAVLASRFATSSRGEVQILGLQSPDAIGIRLHIENFDIPAGDEVYVYGTGENSEVFGPFTGRGPWKNGEFWSGTIEGDTAIIEYYTQGNAADFRVTEVSHMYRSLNSAISPNILSCEVDAACSSETEKNSVGRIVYQNGGGFVCSGTLLNDKDASSFIPYFLTANHCISTQTMASTVEAYWFYQTSACNSGVLRSGIAHTASGSTLLATSQSADQTLIRMLGSMPGGLSFAGWDSGAKSNGTAAFGFHHPGGGTPPSLESYLRRADGSISSTTSSCSASGLTSGYKVDWTSGVTEPGSSGSGLWFNNNGSNYIIGVDSCGPQDPGCSTRFGIYGKFSDFFPSISTYINNSSSSGPANNNFANAQSITGSSGSATGTNVGATKETGEPNHAGNAGGASVWYSWQAPSSGSVTINTSGSDFDTTLGIYTGSSVGALSETASNDDDPNGGLTSRATFNAVSGTTYRIAVDGYNGATGNITLGWNLAGGGTNFTITLSASPVAGGTVSGAGTFASGSSRTVMATPNSGFTFVNWTESGSAVSTSSSYTFTLNGNRTLVANFSQTPPGAPTATTATNITPNSFSANWSASANATGYRLDVSTSNTFNSFVSGFQDLDVGNVLTRSVTGLSSNTNYFYRVRAYNGGGPSSSSNTITVVTLQPQIQFSAANYAVNETGGFLDITVTRIGTGAMTVNHATTNGTAKEGKDYVHAIGVVTLAAGESSKTFPVLIINNALVDGSRTVNLTLSSPSGGTLGSQSTALLTISNDDATQGANPLDTPRSFVQFDYYDFLGRYPDNAGWDYWTQQILNCGSNAQCIEVARIDVSASFFLSIEFQQSGYLVERFYKAAYGSATGNSTLNGAHTLAVPIIRFDEFLRDTQQIRQGVVVLAPGWEALLESNKQAFALQFVQTSRFITAFPTSMTPAQFVDQLNTRAGGNILSTSERTTAINLFGGAGNTTNNTARAQAVRQVAEDQDLFNAEYNRAFVLAEYFGYLRRNPNDAPENTLDYTGFEFWLNKLNGANGNYQNAEMVKAFLSSIEYRQRFGPQ